MHFHVKNQHFLRQRGLKPPHAKTLLQIRILCFKNVTLVSFPNNVIYVYRLILRKVRLERALNYAFWGKKKIKFS